MGVKPLVLLAVLSGFLMVASFLSAHHSVTWAERNKETTIKGSVVEFNFTNPHVILVVQAPDEKGVMQKWTVESASPARLRRAGWTKATIKPGDQITVIGGRAKDGSLLLDAHKFVVNGKEVGVERDSGEYPAD